MRIRIRFRIHRINFDADPDKDPDFYLMRMLIRMHFQVTKMMRILADPDPQHWSAAHSKGYCYIAILYEVLWVQQYGNVTPPAPILSYSQCCGSGSSESGITWPPRFVNSK
jgi:hypothetical protein